MEYTHLTAKLEEIGVIIRDTYKEKLKANGVYATGTLYNSVGYQIVVTEDGIDLKFTAADYYISIEKGRAPNSKMPSIDVIRRWMVTRGLPNKPGLAYVIARSIGIKGIKPKPFLRDTLLEVQVYTPQLKEALELDMKEFIDNNIKGKIKQELNKQ